MNWRKDGLADLAKQGFMKPIKRKMTTIYRVWVNDPDFGECVIATTTDKNNAISASARCVLVGQTYLRTEKLREMR